MEQQQEPHVIQFPKSTEQIKRELIKNHHAAEYEIRQAQRGLERAFYSGMLEVYESSTETGKYGKRANNFRKKLQAIGLDYEACNAVIEAFIYYEQAAARYNDLAARAGIPAKDLRGYMSIAQGWNRGKREAQQEDERPAVIPFNGMRPGH